jgi:hypothetical protein
MDISTKEEQLLKQCDPIFVTELGIMILDKEIQPEKTYSPKLVTWSGIVIYVRLTQL